MSAEKIPERPYNAGDRGGPVSSRETKDQAKSARRPRMRWVDFFAGWPRSPRTEEAPRTQDMRWTCPDCRARHETVIDPDAEAGRIVQVNCLGCGTRHEASVRLPRAGKTGLIVGIVWL